jgi:predicted nucleic-acid-binding protein
VIGLDTNVLLRFFAQDDAKQSPMADAIIASLTKDEPGWVGLATVLELCWVMGGKMQGGKTVVCNTLDRLLMFDTVIVEQAGAVAAAIRQFRTTRADFADCLIAASARAAGCSRTMTFDQIAARDAGMELIS